MMEAALGNNIPKYTGLREALNFLYESAYDYLPLRLQDFVAATCDCSASLAAPQGCVITAERIDTVPHKNRAGYCRVDYLSLIHI